MKKYVSLSLNKKTSLVFILVFTAVAVFDSTVVKFSSYSGLELPAWVHFATFAFFLAIFVLFGTLLRGLTKKNLSSDPYWKAAPGGVRHFHHLINITIVTTIFIALVIITQMLLIGNYGIALLRIQTYISHLSPMAFLAYLIFLLITWSSPSKKNLVVLLYATSFTLVSSNLLVSLIYLDTYFSTSSLPYVKPYPISRYVTVLGGLPLTESLATVFDALSLTSFLLTWVATAILLREYRHKIGRAKYLTLMSIPLVYYIFPFQNYFGDVLFPLLMTSPVTFSIIYVLLFSAAKQVGALFFSLAFLTASPLVHHTQVRNSLLLTSIGMSLLFGSIELAPLQYLVYPPYGLITEAFTPLGAYLLLAGIVASAKYVSGDAKLRKEFYRTASSQLSLLRNIGISQMERDLEKKVRYVETSSAISDLGQEEPFMEEENVKEIIRDVLNELHSKNIKKE